MVQLTGGSVKGIFFNSQSGNNQGKTYVLQVCSRRARVCYLFVGEDALPAGERLQGVSLQSTRYAVVTRQLCWRCDLFRSL